MHDDLRLPRRHSIGVESGEGTLIGVELLEMLKAYVKKDVIHVRVVLEVALIAMARKIIIEEPNVVPNLTLFGIAALILALRIALYFEGQAKRETGHGIL